MTCSNHEKIRPGDRIRSRFWSRRGKTAHYQYAMEQGPKGGQFFKGRKQRTFRDRNGLSAE